MILSPIMGIWEQSTIIPKLSYSLHTFLCISPYQRSGSQQCLLVNGMVKYLKTDCHITLLFCIRAKLFGRDDQLLQIRSLVFPLHTDGKETEKPHIPSCKPCQCHPSGEGLLSVFPLHLSCLCSASGKKAGNAR